MTHDLTTKSKEFLVLNWPEKPQPTIGIVRVEGIFFSNFHQGRIWTNTGRFSRPVETRFLTCLPLFHASYKRFPSVPSIHSTPFLLLLLTEWINWANSDGRKGAVAFRVRSHTKEMNKHLLKQVHGNGPIFVQQFRYFHSSRMKESPEKEGEWVTEQRDQRREYNTYLFDQKNVTYCAIFSFGLQPINYIGTQNYTKKK